MVHKTFNSTSSWYSNNDKKSPEIKFASNSPNTFMNVIFEDEKEKKYMTISFAGDDMPKIRDFLNEQYPPKNDRTLESISTSKVHYGKAYKCGEWNVYKVSSYEQVETVKSEKHIATCKDQLDADKIVKALTEELNS